MKKYKLFNQLSNIIQTIHNMMLHNNFEFSFYYNTYLVTFEYEKDTCIIIDVDPNDCRDKFVILTEISEYDSNRSTSVSQFIHCLVDMDIESVILEDLILKIQEEMIKRI